MSPCFRAWKSRRRLCHRLMPDNFHGVQKSGRTPKHTLLYKVAPSGRPRRHFSGVEPTPGGLFRPPMGLKTGRKSPFSAPIPRDFSPLGSFIGNSGKRATSRLCAICGVWAFQHHTGIGALAGIGGISGHGSQLRSGHWQHRRHRGAFGHSFHGIPSGLTQDGWFRGRPQGRLFFSSFFIVSSVA